MNMTRRAFFLHPARPVGENLENVGEWLLRERHRSAVPISGVKTETRNDPTSARGVGLRNARANMRSNDNE
jgi:hypothetical protein